MRLNYYVKNWGVLILTIIVNNLASAQDYIQIKHDGPTDKPITTLVISKTQLGKQDFFLTNVVLSKTDYKLVKKIILHDLPKQRETESYDFGCFSILISHNNIIDTFYLSERKVSVAFLQKLSSDIEGHNSLEKLNSNIDTLLKRIS